MPGKTLTLLDDDQWPRSGFDFTLPLQRESAALGVIDVQGYVFDAEGHLSHTVRQHSTELQREYNARADVMITNIQQLLAAFRDANQIVFYTRHGAQLPDGSDLIQRRRGREAAALQATGDTSGHMPAKHEPGYEIDPRVGPCAGELVLDKNTSSAFHTTPVDLYLRNLGIDTLILTGVAADQCVLATAIDAADRGFHVILATDAVANLDPGSAEATQILFGRIWGYVMTTADILHWLQTGEPPERTRLSV